MCQFKSGIAIQVSESEVDVRVLPLNDSHTDIREKHNIPEDRCSFSCLSRFSTPVELVPTKLDFDDKSCWKFVFDAGKPDWWVDCMTAQCIDQLLKAAKSDIEAVMSGEKYEKALDLRSLTSIPDGFNPTVGGSLYLESLASIPDGFNPTVGRSLDLRNLTSIPVGFNPTVGGDLYLRNLTSIPEGFNPTVGGYLDLHSLTRIPVGFNPTVGRYLDLHSLTSIPEGFNPTVGGNLYLNSIVSIPDSVRKNVKGKVYLNMRHS